MVEPNFIDWLAHTGTQGTVAIARFTLLVWLGTALGYGIVWLLNKILKKKGGE